MGEVFSRVLEMSLYGSIAILAVLLFRLIFKKCPKKILIIFWIVVAVRLLCPLNFNSPTSILNIGLLFNPQTSSSVTEEQESVTDPVTAVDADEQEHEGGQIVTADGGSSETEDNGAAPADTKPAKDPRLSFGFIAPIVWFVVTIGLLIFSAIRYARFYSKAKWSSRSYDGRYYMANDIDSPFVVGIFDPKIFFPIHMDDDEREYVLNHEWIHIKNKDSLIKLIGYFILCVHWFNPLVWLAFVMLCADIEMRVDEETTDNFDLSMVKEYCRSLVNHASDNKGAFMQSTAFSGLGFGGMETKLRITNLLKKKETTLGFRLISLILTIPVVILISASSLDHRDPWFEKKPDIPQETEESETSESLPVYGWDDGYAKCYADIIDQCEKSGVLYHYALCYIDDDLIPELVTEDVEARHHEYGSEISIYTYKDGKVQTVFEDYYYDAIGSNYYYYLPNCDFLCNVIMENDNDADYYVYTLNGIMSGSDPVITGKVKDGVYYVGGKEVTKDEFTSTLRTAASVIITGSHNADKILEILGVPGNTGGGAGEGSPDDTGVLTTETSETGSYDPKDDPVYGENDAGSDMPGNSGRTFDNLPNGTVLNMSLDDNLDYYIDNEYGKVTLRFLASNKLIITVNGYELVEDVNFDLVVMPYLFKYNGHVYIYWQVRQGEAWSIRVYELSDHSAVYSGTKENTDFNDFYDPGYFMCNETYGNDAICSIRRPYTVSSNGLPQQKTDWCYFGEYDRVRLKNDMRGLVVGDEGIVTDEAVTIHGGDEVYLISSTAGPDYGTLDVKISDGTRIRIDISDAYALCYTRGYDRWLYDYLITKFEKS